MDTVQKEIITIRDKLKILAVEDLGNAIDELKLKLTSSSSVLNSLLTTESKYKDLKRSIITGTLKYEDIVIYKAQLLEKYLLILDALSVEDISRRYAKTKVEKLLKKGGVFYRIPPMMELDKQEKCVVRLAFKENQLTDKLDQGHTDVIKPVRIANVMSVEFIDPSEDTFVLKSYSEKTQFVDQEEYSEWTFYVTPKRLGQFNLLLKILVIELREGIERKKEVVLEEKIRVDSVLENDVDLGFKELSDINLYMLTTIPYISSSIRDTRQKTLSKNINYLFNGVLVLVLGFIIGPVNYIDETESSVILSNVNHFPIVVKDSLRAISNENEPPIGNIFTANEEASVDAENESSVIKNTYKVEVENKSKLRIFSSHYDETHFESDTIERKFFNMKVSLLIDDKKVMNISSAGLRSDIDLIQKADMRIIYGSDTFIHNPLRLVRLPRDPYKPKNQKEKIGRYQFYDEEMSINYITPVNYSEGVVEVIGGFFFKDAIYNCKSFNCSVSLLPKVDTLDFKTNFVEAGNTYIASHITVNPFDSDLKSFRTDDNGAYRIILPRVIMKNEGFKSRPVYIAEPRFMSLKDTIGFQTEYDCVGRFNLSNNFYLSNDLYNNSRVDVLLNIPLGFEGYTSSQSLRVRKSGTKKSTKILKVKNDPIRFIFSKDSIIIDDYRVILGKKSEVYFRFKVDKSRKDGNIVVEKEIIDNIPYFTILVNSKFLLDKEKIKIDMSIKPEYKETVYLTRREHMCVADLSKHAVKFR